MYILDWYLFAILYQRRIMKTDQKCVVRNLYTPQELNLLSKIKVSTIKQKEKFFDTFLDRVYNDELDDPVEVQFTKYLQETVNAKLERTLKSTY